MKRISSLLIVLILILSLTTMAQAAEVTDVAEDSPYAEAVQWALDNELITGYSDGTFRPNATCTRGHAAAILWRAAGEPKATSQNNPFVDVKSTSYYYEAVLWAVEEGITTGIDDTHFGPDSNCSRSQVVTFLYRAFGQPSVGNAANPFKDVPAGKWYTDPVRWAVKEGITTGKSATEFSPDEVCNRSQVVTFLYRAYN